MNNSASFCNSNSFCSRGGGGGGGGGGEGGGQRGRELKELDQYQYLGNCPPTPPLTQQQSIDNKLGLMLG